jgi:hypothetical protein
VGLTAILEMDFYSKREVILDIQEVVFPPRKYKVLWETPVHDYDDGTHCYGNVNHTNMVIKLDPAFPEWRIKQTILHEMLHIVENVFGMDLEEGQLENLTIGLDIMLRENPEIFRLLMKGE